MPNAGNQWVWSLAKGKDGGTVARLDFVIDPTSI